jgi:hypothetical protein
MLDYYRQELIAYKDENFISRDYSSESSLRFVSFSQLLQAHPDKLATFAHKPGQGYMHSQSKEPIPMFIYPPTT